jgi:hypothetical protein
VKQLALAILLAAAFAFAVLQPRQAIRHAPSQPAPAQEGSAGRFEAFDVYIDSGGIPLGAYQVELNAGAESGVKIVGIEGGEGVFAAAPYYDPKAIQNDRVILGALSTEQSLPAGRTRVARIHVIAVGAAEWRAVLMAAGSADGQRINAKVQVEPAAAAEGAGK